MSGVRTVEGAGLRCVQVLLKLRQQMADALPGTVFHVVTDDPAASLDLDAWCHMTGHTFLGELEEHQRADGVPVYTLRLEEAAQPTDPARPWHPQD
ncbi:sulfurtransferase TusA family protein [Streptomyces sp. S.PB5]|uniref:sulfurtransferase TusA family protein n=1 Tax=Streptomyces sp. S.PB5 TaxID=3020844 RepID=UPI0025AF78D8|nr:sulfurtransferase TusA family protein [Streptomyces sp. S.PB5]MDN3028602.1 sulfurtransferase TusA family protein [Streptomyces sp. S.PB5]